jgi:hypothetical protein
MFEQGLGDVVGFRQAAPELGEKRVGRFLRQQMRPQSCRGAPRVRQGVLQRVGEDTLPNSGVLRVVWNPGILGRTARAAC